MPHYEGSVFSLPGLLLAGTGSKMTTEELIHQLLGVTRSPAYTCTIQEAWGQQTSKPRHNPPARHFQAIYYHPHHQKKGSCLVSLSYDTGFPFWPVFMGFPSKDLPMPQSSSPQPGHRAALIAA